MKLKRKAYYVLIAVVIVFVGYILISIWWINNFGAYYYNEPDVINPAILMPEKICTDSEGTVITQLCCLSVNDFPDTCLMGACGCVPTSSHDVKVCDCGEGKCWKEAEGCIATP